MMTPVFIVAIVFGGIVLALGIVCATVLMGLRLRHGGFSRKSRQAEANEAKMIQDIYHGLSKMETRIDALETILMDRRGKDQPT